MESTVKDFITQLQKTQITDNLTLGQESKKLNHQTGLICFLQGYCLEKGFQTQPNIELAQQNYEYGLIYFIDPLCAMQLEQIYAKQKKKAQQQFCSIIYFLLINIIYEIQQPQRKADKSDIDKINEALQQLAPTVELPLNRVKDFLIALYKYQLNQCDYSDLLVEFEQMGSKVHAYPIVLKLFQTQTNNQDKAPEKVYKLCKLVNPQQFLTQCLYNISLHGMQENCHLNSIRSLLFEIGFIHTPEPYKQVIEQLYLRQTSTVLHRILLIRKHAKAQKSFEIQQEELKFIDQTKTPISYYLCGKRQTNKSKICYLCKSKELFNNIQINSDIYINFVYEFYKAKLQLHHQQHEGYKEFIDVDLFEKCKMYYENNIKLFKQVRTLQFYTLRLRIDQQKDKITFKNKLIQQYFDQQKILSLEYSRQSFQQLQKSIIETKKSQLFQSKNIIQTQSILVQTNIQQEHFNTNQESKFLTKSRTIQGPQFFSQSQKNNFNQSRFIDLENKQNDFVFIQTNQLIDLQFLSKSNRDGQLYLGNFEGNQVFIKSLPFMNYKQVEKYFNNLNPNLSHLNIREIIGFNIEDLQQEQISGMIKIVTKKYNYNLKTYLKKNKPTPKELWHLAIQIIDGIYYLHQNGFKFCNLNPNNIMIDYDTPILIDFDLQYEREFLDKRYTCQIDEETPLFTDKIDLYSIGCILLFMFFGCEFTFQNILNSQIVSLEIYKTIDPYLSKDVEFLLPPSVELLEERARQMILKCLNGTIELIDLLKEFYDNA